MTITPYSLPHFRQPSSGMVLVGTRLRGHDTTQFPPALAAHGGGVLEPVDIGPLGVIHSFTTIHLGKQPSYRLALVDFPGGLRVFGRLLDPRQPAAIGAEVRVVPHALADGTPDYAFETL